MGKDITVDFFKSQTDDQVNFSIDEVVSVLISEYEDNLYIQRNQISDRIKQIRKELDDLDKSVIDEIKSSIGKYQLTDLDLSAEPQLNDITLYHHHVSVPFVIRFGGERQCKVTKKLPIPFMGYKNKKKELDSELVESKSQLRNILDELRDMSRKERKVRAEISRKRLIASGYGDMLNHKSLKKLIQVK